MKTWLQGYFVTGTDTDVGKSIASAWLMLRLAADYWKPVQSGSLDNTDTQIVQRLTGCEACRFHPSTFCLSHPLSPHESARRDGIAIALDDFSLPSCHRPLVVEGAGGLLVPLNDRHFMIDLIVRLNLPVILVARTTLGTINHTLLSLEALRLRHIPVQGVILNGPDNPANFKAIRTYGKIPILAHIPTLGSLNSTTLAQIHPLESIG
ncbi:MAG: dethiobiotin synthase [Magnetococcales bacterium]|nr:dethiobiotin synthase [Magnetococcales bacterium]